MHPSDPTPSLVSAHSCFLISAAWVKVGKFSVLDWILLCADLPQIVPGPYWEEDAIRSFKPSKSTWELRMDTEAASSYEVLQAFWDPPPWDLRPFHPASFNTSLHSCAHTKRRYMQYLFSSHCIPATMPGIFCMISNPYNNCKVASTILQQWKVRFREVSLIHC